MNTEIEHKEFLKRLALPVNHALYDQEDKIEVEFANFISYRGLEVYPPLLHGLPHDMATFYRSVKAWKVKWSTLPSAGFQLEGSINILPLAEIHKIGDSTFLPDENPVMKGFRLVDYFYNEGAVGFYIGEPERGLYLFKFDGETEPLMLDFGGYLQLLLYTKGVGYWQNLIITHVTKKVQGNVLGIREKMPKLFPDFSEQGFIELYESVRLR